MMSRALRRVGPRGGPFRRRDPRAEDRDFYRSEAWLAARAEALARANYTCARCPATERLDVHHKIPITRGGPKTAQSNLVVLCKPCHDSQH